VAAGFAPARIDDVLARYDESQRAYHSRRHIRQMLVDADRFSISLSSAQALAVLFHDAIYVPGASQGANEALSAQLLRVCASDIAAEVVDEAAAIVIDTAQHLPRTPSAALVIDLDLLRLSASAAQFQRHTRAVFAEVRPLYRTADDDVAWRQFAERRSHFFRRLLARPSIYSTPIIRARCEDAARANLQAAVNAAGNPETA
jgi:predicted metal-dependent HD superfamily phosphohydrolase